jgi:outer membrane protein X
LPHYENPTIKLILKKNTKMKKVLFILSIFLAATAAIAQTDSARIFKPFKVDVSVGFALPLGGSSATKVGFLFVVEPKYAVAEQFAIGLRLEVALMARGTVINGNEFEGNVQGNGSYLATGDYYFNNNRFRPFIGAGAGLYQIGAADFNSQDPTLPTNIPTDNKFGFMFRGGFEAGHFRLGVEYNAVGKSQYSEHNSYIGFKLGTCIGGGRYKK